MSTLSETLKEEVYLDWRKGKHTLAHLAKKYRISEASVSVIITKKLKSKK